MAVPLVKMGNTALTRVMLVGLVLVMRNAMELSCFSLIKGIGEWTSLLIR